MTSIFQGIILPRGDTAANLAANNIIPLSGERVRETDTGKWKTGDGVTHYNDLPYDVDRSDVSMRAPQRVQLTDNCIGRCQNMTVTSVGTYRFAHRVGVAGTDIQLGFGNFYTGLNPNIKDFDPATSVTFSAAFEDAAGNVYAATFNGQRSVVLPGGGSVLSDPLPINVAVSDVVWVRVYISAGTAYSNRGTGLSSVGGFTAATDLTASGAGAVGATFAIGGFDAMCIVGTPTSTNKPRSVAVQGDSLAVGIGDGPYAGNEFGYLPQVAVNPYYCGGGYLQRALSGHAGSIIEAQTGDSVNNFLTGVAHFRRDALTRFTKYAVVEYGRNDVSAGRTAVQVQTDLLKQATRNIARGIIGNVIVTLTPISTSTDNWATIENQTAHATEAIRVAHNAWVRAGCPIVSGAPVAVGTSGALLAGQPGHPIKGYIEVADSVESARDSGKWKAANRAVTDASISSSGTTLTSATANFTSADIGRDVNVAGAGAAGGVLTAVITTINSSTSVTLTTPASTTVSGAICAIGVYTGDGTHSSVGGHAAMATAIQAPLLALLS